MEKQLTYPDICNNFTKFDRKTPIDDIATYIQDMVAQDKWIKITIGTDSKFRPLGNSRGHRKGLRAWAKTFLEGKKINTYWSCSFFTAITFAHNGGGKGHHIIIREENVRGTTHYSKFDRLWREVVMSVDLAKWIEEKTGVKVEIHFDLNTDVNYESNQLVAAALGYATEAGFVSQCKPDALTASKAADHFVKIEDKSFSKNKRKRRLKEIIKEKG